MSNLEHETNVAEEIGLDVAAELTAETTEPTGEVKSIFMNTTPCESLDEIYALMPAAQNELRAHIPTGKKSVPAANLKLADAFAPGASIQKAVSDAVSAATAFLTHLGKEHSVYNPAVEGSAKKKFIIPLKDGKETSSSLTFLEVCAKLEKATADRAEYERMAMEADPKDLPLDAEKRAEALKAYAEANGLDISNGLDAAAIHHTTRMAEARKWAVAAAQVKKDVKSKFLEEIYNFHKARLSPPGGKKGGALSATKAIYTLLDNKSKAVVDSNDKFLVVNDWLQFKLPHILTLVRHSTSPRGEDGKVLKGATPTVTDGTFLAEAAKLFDAGKTAGLNYPKETPLSKWKDSIGSKNPNGARMTVLGKQVKSVKGAAKQFAPIIKPFIEQLREIGVTLGDFNTGDVHASHIRVPFRTVVAPLMRAFLDGRSHQWDIPATLEQCEAVRHIPVEEKFTGATYHKIASGQRPFVWHHQLPVGWVPEGLLEALGINAGPTPTGGFSLDGSSLAGRWCGQMILGTDTDNVISSQFHATITLDEDNVTSADYVDGQQRITISALLAGGFVPVPTTGTPLDAMTFGDGTAATGSGRLFLTRQTQFEAGDIKNALWEQEGAVFLDEVAPELYENFMNCKLSIALYDFTQSDPQEWPGREMMLFEKLNNGAWAVAMKVSEMFSQRLFKYEDRAKAVASLFESEAVRTVFRDSSDARLKKAVTELGHSNLIPPTMLAFIGYLITDMMTLLSDRKLGYVHGNKAVHTDVIRTLGSNFLTDDMFFDALICIKDVLETAAYSRMLHKAIDEKGNPTYTVNAKTKEQKPVYNDNRVIDATRGMMKYRMPMFEIEMSEDGKKVASVAYTGGTLTSIADQLADSKALDNFWDDAFFRSPNEMYTAKGIQDPWKEYCDRVNEDARKTGVVESDKDLVSMPQSLVIGRRSSKGVIYPMSAHYHMSNGRNNVGSVIRAGNVYSTLWECWFDGGSDVSSRLGEVLPESDMPGEEGEE